MNIIMYDIHIFIYLIHMYFSLFIIRDNYLIIKEAK